LPTGQAIINSALEILGINELGGTPSASESQAALNELNSMWNAWGIDEGLIYAEVSITKALLAATASYTIGPTGSFVAVVPGKIYRAFIIASDGSRNEIDIVNADRYYAHNDLAAAAVTPDEVYPDFNIDPTTGFPTIYLWPVNTGTPTLQLVVGATFTTWALGTTYNIPQGYQDAIQYALAWRLIPRFGVIVPDVIKQEVAGLAEKAELRIREMNKFNRQLQPGTEMLQPPPQPGGPRA
jgi:hypothetical protein